jgi:hypothetical protein
MFPRLVVPGDGAEPKASVAQAAGKPSPGPAAADAKKPAAATNTSPTGADTPPAPKPADKLTDKPTDEPQALPAESQSEAAEAVAATPPPAGGVLGSVFVVGIGMAIALVVLFALTFFVLRPR